jgi:hypothetical protein
MTELKVGNFTCIVSAEDYNRFKAMKLQGSEGQCIKALIDKKWIPLHHIVIGKPTTGMVVYHLNGNKCDNRRENLRFATISENNQNSKRKHKGQYIGVYYNENKKHWRVYCKRVYFGSFKSEIEAAQQYDKAAHILFGENAKTNKTIAYDDVKEKYTVEDLMCKETRDLPQNISFYRNKYHVKIEFEDQKYRRYCIDTLEEAQKVLQEFKDEINGIKEKRERIHNMKQIERNGNGISVIRSYGEEILVDDDIWHEYSVMNWNISDGYAKTNVGNTSVFMHRMIVNANVNDIVDHINRNRLDNRRCNLRIVQPHENSHNRSKKKNATSSYFGVHRNHNKWVARFRFKGEHVYCGTFETEIEAAKAYNTKAIELYGNCANINIF